MRDARVLVTGVSGFIGTHVAAALHAAGADVVGVDVRPGRFRTLSADVCDGAAMRSAVSGADALVHLAGIPGVRGAGPRYREVNHDGMVATFDAAIAAGVRRLVLASSSSVYAPGRAALAEDAPLAPRSDYARSKAEAEITAARLCRGWAELVILRYFTVYGPGQRPDMLCHRLLASALDGTPVEIFGPGSATRPFTFVDDVVAATLAAVERPAAAGVYNVAGARSSSVLQAAAIVAELVGRPPLLVHRPRLAVDAGRVAADTGRAARELGHRPATTLADGLARQHAALLARDVAAAV